MATPFWKASRIAVFFLALAVAAPSFGQYPIPQNPWEFDYSQYPPIHHAVPYHKQETMVWCWVASAKMICEYYGRMPVPSQCEMLQSQYDTPCCQSPELCARPGQMFEIQALIARFGGRYSGVSMPANGFVLYDQLRRGPIIMQTRQGSGHAIVATGMRIVPSNFGPLGIVSINDPLYGQYEVDFPTLIQAWLAALVVY
ncbi:MAG: papain-like cysteine protease family protein [Syntrophobacter sp.]